MAKRTCVDCHCITDRTRCPDCARVHDRARGTREQRGYGPAHRRLRAEWQAKLDAGETVWCWRCLATGTQTRIDPSHWHLGHDDTDRGQYRGPECVPCNTATRARIAQPNR